MSRADRNLRGVHGRHSDGPDCQRALAQNGSRLDYLVVDADTCTQLVNMLST